MFRTDFWGGVQPFTGDFGGHRSTKFNQTQGRKNYFSTNFFYLAKLLESSLKMYFGPLGTSWGSEKVWKPKTAKKCSNLGSVPFWGGYSPLLETLI